MIRLVLIFAQILIAISVFSQSYRFTTTNLNLRKGPSSAYNILTVIPLNSNVTLEENCACEWIKVSYNGYVGYVNSYYLTTNNSKNNLITPNNNFNSTIRYYTNIENKQVQAPTYYNSIPEGATAVCRDGTYSFSLNERGTCSRHGGVARWLR
jgi:uncharacterized protein YgiM (DUF1202 family)